MVGCSLPSLVLIIPMPHKHNVARRHHIPKMSFKVQNWPAYEAGLRRRGSLTLWIEDAALECWQTIGPSGQARYREAAILTSLMLRTAFKLALRQTEGLMTSVLTLMGLTLSAPDHSTVSRRAVTLPMIQPAQVLRGPLAQTQQSCHHGPFRSETVENGCRRTCRSGSDIRDRLMRHGKWRNPVGSGFVAELLSFATS
jgi:Transposase DDE domain